MAQSILIFDFGTNEEAAQQARHKIESWQQGLRLGKKVLFKFERGEAVEESGEAAKPEGGAAAEESSSKAKTKTGKKKAAKGKEDAGEGANGEAAARIRLLIRLGFSDHEKLIQQRVLDRFAAEEPFKSAQGETIRQGNPAFAESADLFDSLD
jgi:hypothetical protein